MWRVYVLALALVVACDEGARTGELIADGFAIRDLTAQDECGCWWSEYGFPSFQACLAELGGDLPDWQYDCVVRAGRPYGEFEARAECNNRAESARYSCYTNLTACDGDAYNACDDAHAAAEQACWTSHDPCFGRAGADLAECESRRAAMLADISACD